MTILTDKDFDAYREVFGWHAAARRIVASLDAPSEEEQVQTFSHGVGPAVTDRCREEGWTLAVGPHRGEQRGTVTVARWNGSRCHLHHHAPTRTLAMLRATADAVRYAADHPTSPGHPTTA